MLIIKRIEIKGIWGQKDIETDFNKDVNIFIGINGTGKTTFLNIIESILTVDFEALSRIDFETVTLFLNGKKSRKITVKKALSNSYHNSYNTFEYKVGNKKFNVPQIPHETEYPLHRIHHIYQYQINELKNELGTLIKICWLSVNRDIQNNKENEFASRRENSSENSVDVRLKDLMKRLAIYQLHLEAESSSLTTEFRNKMYELMLYNKDFDELDLKKPITINADIIKNKLTKAYKDLGLTKKYIIERINIHTQKLSEALDRIEKVKNETKQQLTINDIPPISLLNRTLELIKISTDIEEQKSSIFKPINTYLDILKKFIKNKSFKLDTKGSGELLVFNKDSESNPFTIYNLSSGEKQLIILLTETLLQRSTIYIFIADEPELSLHINWQRKIVGAIKTLNSNSQIILATHSPEIAGKWSNKIINMENITKQTKNA